MEGFQAIIGQMGVFVICAQAIMHFRPKEVYEKYLRLLLSVMIMMQLFQPVYGLFSGENTVEWEVSLQSFQENLDKSMEEAAGRAAESEALLQDMSMETVQERVEQTEEAIQIEEIKIEVSEVSP